MSNLTAQEKLENFAFQYGRRFTIKEAAKLCSVKEKTASNYLRKMKLNGKLKVLKKNKQIEYFWNSKVSKRNKAGPYWDFTPNKGKLESIYNLIAEPKTLHEVLVYTEMSKRTAQRYLRVLQMLFLVKLVGGKYIRLSCNLPPIHSFRDIKIQYKKERIRRLNAEIEAHKQH